LAYDYSDALEVEVILKSGNFKVYKPIVRCHDGRLMCVLKDGSYTFFELEELRYIRYRMLTKKRTIEDNQPKIMFELKSEGKIECDDYYSFGKGWYSLKKWHDKYTEVKICHSGNIINYG